MKHLTAIQLDEESVRRGGSTRYAACLCGWKGPDRATIELAGDDAIMHEADATLQKENQLLREAIRWFNTHSASRDDQPDSRFKGKFLIDGCGCCGDAGQEPPEHLRALIHSVLDEPKVPT